jgi:protein TonB
LRAVLADTKIDLGFMPTRVLPPRLPASLLASAGAHAIALAMLVRLGGPLAFPNELPRAQLIPVSLVSLPGGGGGPAGEAAPVATSPPAAAPAPPAAPPATIPTPAPMTKPVVRRKMPRPETTAKPRAEPPTPQAAAVAPAGAEPGASGATVASLGGGKGTGGGGDGTGGDGSGGARPAYGSNPRPPYPLAARRLGQEGRVTLEVVVRPDGRAQSVRVKQSSGYRLLDESAVHTVKTKWRFVPARNGGVPTTGTATVPIRFQIKEG